MTPRDHHLRTPPAHAAESRVALARRVLPALLLPLLIWAACTLFLGADLGKSSDDYFLNLRDPVTGAVPEGTSLFKHFPYFWRPLHIAMTFGVGTYFWEYDRAIHVFVALMHGAACLGLWLLLRRTLRSAVAPAAATLLFMALPLNFEVLLWFSTACTSIGAALFLCAALLTIRIARAERPGALLWALSLVVFAAACFYEQAAAGSAALPALVLATSPRSSTIRARVLRAAGAAIAGGAACILYIVLLQQTAPDDFIRGSTASLVGRERVMERALSVGRSVADGLWGTRAMHTWLGGLRQGWATAASPEGLVWGGLLLAAAASWLAWVWRTAAPVGDPPVPADSESSTARRGWIALFGAGVFVAAWLPIAALERQSAVPRSYYIPLLGLAIVLGAAFDTIVCLSSSRTGRRGPARGTALVLGIVALFGSVVGAVGMIGFQTLFQNRSRMDRDELRQLAELVPAPPPGAVFLPMDTRSSRPTRTGLELFDRCRPGVFETRWSAHREVQRLYRRTDVSALNCNPWLPASGFLQEPTRLGVRYVGRLGEGRKRSPAGEVYVPWHRAIPFTIDADGRVRLVRRVDVEMADHRDLTIRPPLVQHVLAERKSRGLTTPVAVMRLSHQEERTDLLPIEQWEWNTTRTPVEFTDVWIWSQDDGTPTPRRATWLHTQAQSGHRSAMSVAIPPRERPQLLLVRATIAEYDLSAAGLLPARSGSAPSPSPSPGREPAVLELFVHLASDPGRVLGTLRLEPRQLAQLRGWTPFIVEVPGTPKEDRWVIALRSVPGQPNQAPRLPVWITQGLEQLPPVTPP